MAIMYLLHVDALSGAVWTCDHCYSFRAKLKVVSDNMITDLFL